MEINAFIDTMGHPEQIGYWQIKAEKDLPTGVKLTVCWNQWDGQIAAIESRDGVVIGHNIRNDEIVTPDYVVIKNYVWTDEHGPWVYLP